MFGVGTSIWNRALAGKGDGSGGNPPAGVTPLHSLDLTTAPSASNAFDDYGLATSRTVTDYNWRIVQIPADAVPMGGLRPVRNLLANDGNWYGLGNAVVTDNGDGTHSVSGFGSLVADRAEIRDQFNADVPGRTFVGRIDVRGTGSDIGKTLRLGVVRYTGGTYVLNFATVTLSADWQTVSPPVFEGLTDNVGVMFRIFGGDTNNCDSCDFRCEQIQDITHRADLSTAPDEYVSTDDDYGTGVLGFRYFDTELANTVASNVVTEGTGASIAGWLDYQPGDTNYADCTHDFSGGADTITLTATGYYTLWLEGTAQVSIAAGTATITGAGAATEGNPVTINCTATGTVTLTLDSDTLDEWGAYQIIQLNDGTVPTAFIPSSGSASRPAMNPAPTIAGLVGTEDARLVVKGLAADLVTPDPTDTTERTLDVDNTDGEFDTLPSPIKVLSIDVYNDGERPA